MSDKLNEKFEEFVTEQKVIVENAADPMPTVSATVSGPGIVIFTGFSVAFCARSQSCTRNIFRGFIGPRTVGKKEE